MIVHSAEEDQKRIAWLRQDAHNQKEPRRQGLLTALCCYPEGATGVHGTMHSGTAG